MSTPEIYTLSLHDALPIFQREGWSNPPGTQWVLYRRPLDALAPAHRGDRSEEHTSELQSRENLVCRLLLEKKKWRLGICSKPAPTYLIWIRPCSILACRWA